MYYGGWMVFGMHALWWLFWIAVLIALFALIIPARCVGRESEKHRLTYFNAVTQQAKFLLRSIKSARRNWRSYLHTMRQVSTTASLRNSRR